MGTSKIINRILREKLQAIRDKKLFPKGYALTVADKVGCKRNKVYHTFSGNNADVRIMEGLVELAEEQQGVSGKKTAAVDLNSLDDKQVLEEFDRIRELNLLPRGYGQKVADKVGCEMRNVHYVVAGDYIDLKIIKGIIEVVYTSKEVELLERLNRLLGKNM